MLNAQRASRAVFLTLDDGPHPEHTPRVLDRLAEANVRATFFVIGREAEKHPEIVHRMIAEGHSIGDHTWSHQDIRTLPKTQFLDELRRSSELLSSITGSPIRLFRPPYGKLGARQFIMLLRLGYTVTLWNIDTRDYLCRSELDVREQLNGWKMRSGDIVLLHDCMEHAPASIEWIIRQARLEAAHLSFGRL